MLAAKHLEVYGPAMSKDLNPQKALIFRIVHKENLGGILSGGCHCRATTAGQGYVDIGNLELIHKRATRMVPCPPGGTLSDYVPFYFTPYSPMLLNIKTGHNGVTKHPMRDIVILVSSLPHLSKCGIKFVFSDRHAYLKTALFSNDLADLDRIIWPALQARDFKRDDTDKVERYQAEALVYRHVPLTALLGVICYDEAAKAAVELQAAECGVTIKVAANSGWYF